MKTAKKIFAFYLFFLFAFVLIIYGNGHCFMNEPDGYMRILWGTDISTLKNMEFIAAESTHGDVKIYKKNREEMMMLAGATLSAVRYFFWQGKFCSASVESKGLTNWTRFKNNFIKSYSRGYQPGKNEEKYVWYGHITGMVLEYDKSANKTYLYVYSVPLLEKMGAMNKQKAMEGTAPFMGR
jgi:hypothetical protein